LTKIEGDRVLETGLAFPLPDFGEGLYISYLAEKGAKLYSDDWMQITLGEGEAKNISQYYFDAAKAKFAQSPINPSPSWSGEDFLKGTLAMYQAGFWYGAMAESDVTKGKVMMIPAPTWAGSRRDTAIGGTGAIITGKTVNPDVSWAYYEWHYGGWLASERAKGGWGVPAHKRLYDLIPQNTDFEKQKLRVLQAELELNTPPLEFNPYTDPTIFSASFTKYFEQALKDEISLDEMLGNMEMEIDASIKDNLERMQS
jgi:multiple sugar transport system substrate-binding protein